NEYSLPDVELRGPYAFAVAYQAALASPFTVLAAPVNIWITTTSHSRAERTVENGRTGEAVWVSGRS
ncbi:MAG: hypothetical protein VW600_11700, partial [Ferrovibrio sp.]